VSMNVFSSLFISSASQLAPYTALKVISDTTLAAPAGSLSTGTIDTTGYIYIKCMAFWDTLSGASNILMFLNNDTAAHKYGYRYEENAAGQVSVDDTTAIQCSPSASTQEGMILIEINNLVGAHKQVAGRVVRGAGFTLGHESIFSGVYDSTGTITRITVDSGANFPAGSRIVVMGL